MMASEPRNIILHVGYPKSGSTTLQREVFPRVSGIELWAPGVDGFPDPHELVPRPPALYGTDASKVAAGLMPHIKRASDPLLVSSEFFMWQAGLWGAEYMSDADQRVTPGNTAHHLGRTVAWPLESTASVKALIVTRRQGDWLPSMYAEIGSRLIAHGYFREGIEEFIDWYFYVHGGDLVRYLQFDEVAAAFQAGFGSERVHVTPMEALFDAADGTARRDLARFVGVSPDDMEAAFAQAQALNVGLAEGQWLPKKKRANTLTPIGRMLASIKRIGPSRGAGHLFTEQGPVRKLLHRIERRERSLELKPFQLQAARREEVTRWFKASNEGLRSWTSSDLVRYGYLPSLNRPTAYSGEVRAQQRKPCARRDVPTRK